VAVLSEFLATVPQILQNNTKLKSWVQTYITKWGSSET